MSESREEINVKTTLPPSPVVKLPEETSPVTDAVAGVRPVAAITMSPDERAQRKAMLVSAYERGVTNDRMKVDLPPDMHGEWVRRDQFEIDQMRKMGFEIDNEFAPKRSLHSDGTGAAIVADVVFMTCSRENKELIDEVKHERKLAVHTKKGIDREEKDFAAATRQETGGIIPTTLESKTREVRKDDIASAMEAMNTQTQPQR